MAILYFGTVRVLFYNSHYIYFKYYNCNCKANPISNIPSQHELEQEKRNLKRELKLLQEKLKDFNHQLRDGFHDFRSLDNNMNSGVVPEKFLRKIKELGNLVKDHVKDNKTMAETIAKLTDERQFLQEKIAMLEQQNRVHLPFDDPVARVSLLIFNFIETSCIFRFFTVLYFPF